MVFSLKKKGRIRIISGDFSKRVLGKEKFDHIIGSEAYILPGTEDAHCQALLSSLKKLLKHVNSGGSLRLSRLCPPYFYAMDYLPSYGKNGVKLLKFLNGLNKSGNLVQFNEHGAVIIKTPPAV